MAVTFAFRASKQARDVPHSVLALRTLTKQASLFSTLPPLLTTCVEGIVAVNHHII